MPSRRHLLALALVAAVALGACSGGGGGSGSGDLPVTGSTTTTRPAPTTTAPGAPTTTVAPEPGAAQPRFTRFEVTDPPPCTGTTATASVTFETADATTVAFAVDQVSVTGGPEVPVSGAYPVPVPCDGRSHTVLAVAVGPGGQAVASGAANAVRA